jgi:predicted aldo/keto reductase-like oxidoreductase
MRLLGRTGVPVSLLGLGGSHIGRQSDAGESVRIIRAAIDEGVTFLDNSWDYNEGESERRMGRALRDGYRDRVFLMTKIDGRTGESASRQLDESLERLEVDHVDLVQFHEVIRPSDPHRIFAEDGAFEAIARAREAGKTRFIGFTGHKSPAIHLKMIETGLAHGIVFDTVQMPLNVVDAHYESFERHVLPVARRHNIGVLGMKPLGEGQIVKDGGLAPVECLHYAMNLPVSVVITGCESMAILDQALRAVRSFRPMTDNEVQSLLNRTALLSADGHLEAYKTTHAFDSTVEHPEWLG